MVWRWVFSVCSVTGNVMPHSNSRAVSPPAICARAAFTATGCSCAIQWPDFTTTSVRSLQSPRIGSAKREFTVSQVVS